MGRSVPALFLALSGVTALGSAALVFGAVSAYERGALLAVPEATVTVTVARRDLARGETISADDLALVELPATFVPDAAIRAPDQVVGRVPREVILRDEPIREERLVGMAQVPTGLRALTITGAELTGVVAEGRAVDVHVDGIVALRGVTVLAVGEGVTLLVAPEDAERLAHVAAMAELVLSPAR